MSRTKFLVKRANFSGDNSTLNFSVSTNFPTEIIDLTAAVQSWKLETGSDREIRHFSMQLSNIQNNGSQGSCDVAVTLASSDPQWKLNAEACYIDVVFTAVCE